MKYTEKYLEEQGKPGIGKKALSALLGPLVGLGVIGAGTGIDVLSGLVRPPLDLATALGKAQRLNTINRQKSTFGGQDTSQDLAIKAILAREVPGLLTKAGERAGQAINYGLFTKALQRLQR